MSPNYDIQYLPKLEVGSSAWHDYRKSGLGASEVGAVLGVCPWKTPVDVWLEKTGRTEPFAGNNATYWGTLLEDLVAREYAKKIGKKVRRYGFMMRRGYLICDIDRLVHDEGTLPAIREKIVTDRAMDAKTARDKSLWADGLPMSYEAQGLCYMAVMPSVQVMDFACLFMAERDLEIYPLLRDDSAIAEILERIDDWWTRHILRGETPEPTSEEDCKALWGRHRPETVCMSTPEVVAALDAIADAKARAKQAEVDEAEAKRIVMAAMQENEALKSPDGKTLATWKNAKDSTKTDWEAVARDAGATEDLIAKHTKNVPGSRRFLAK